jgi:hypothetical protein
MTDIAHDLFVGVETAMADKIRTQRWGLRQKVQLSKLIYHRLKQAIQSFDVCGLQPRCHLSVPIQQEEWKRPDIEVTQRILLLLQELPALSLAITADVFEKFFPDAADIVWLKLKPELDRVVEETIKPVLYENPYCEGCPLCNDKSQLSPWGVNKPRNRSD